MRDRERRITYRGPWASSPGGECQPWGVRRSFNELVNEAAHAPIGVWDFGWLDGRATEERPSWRYFDRVAERAATVSRMLDLQTGAGQMIADLPKLPRLTVATEGHNPNVAIASCRLRQRGAWLVRTQEDRPALPLASNSFELVTSRHPVDTRWDEIARVLRSGGTYLSQQVGPHSLRDLSELMMGPLPPGSKRDPELARVAAEKAGLKVTDLRHERLRTVFYDIGAVIYFLRLVVWIVPDFTIEKYREELLALHHRIEREGGFETSASRFLIEAVKD